MPQYDLDQLLSGIHKQERFAISKAITLVESRTEKDQTLATALLSKLEIKSPAFRIVVTGAPGVGKSTFINRFADEIANAGFSIAILATDPSSQISKGSILGDKTRMGDIQNASNIYIRPSASANHLGGVSKKSLEKMDVLEAAGFDIILLETVGVGQSEFESYRLSDLFLLLVNPGAGDELQGIKRGIVEMADIICINKADGETIGLAEQTKRAYQSSSKLLTNPRLAWETSFYLISALESQGIDKLWQAILSFKREREENGKMKENRLVLEEALFREQAKAFIMERLILDSRVENLINEQIKKLSDRKQTISQSLLSIKESIKEII